MNFNPFFPPTVTNLPPTFTTLPPIVTRRVNIVNRPHIITQPHIQEQITQFNNQIIKRNIFCDQPQCCENTCCCEESCHIGRCPGPMFPIMRPFVPGPIGFTPTQGPAFGPGPGPAFGPGMQNMDNDMDMNQGMF